MSDLSAALNNLAEIRTTNGVGTKLTVSASIDRAVNNLERDLEDISSGEWNGMPIKDSSKIPNILEVVLKPVLDVTSAVVTASHANKNIKSLSIDFDDRAKTGEIEIDMRGAQEKLETAINGWLAKVAELEDTGVIPPGVTGKPLAINDNARNTHQLYRLSDVLSHLKSWKPHDLVTDNRAAEINSKIAASAPVTPAAT